MMFELNSFRAPLDRHLKNSHDTDRRWVNSQFVSWQKGFGDFVGVDDIVIEACFIRSETAVKIEEEKQLKAGMTMPASTTLKALPEFAASAAAVCYIMMRWSHHLNPKEAKLEASDMLQRFLAAG